MSNFDKARDQALKILGKDAEIPERPAALVKASSAFSEVGKDFKTAREACQAKVLDMDNANSAFMNAAQQFRAKLEKNDFGLDAKKDLKKIQQAQKILTAEVDLAIKELQTNDKALDELTKHLEQVVNYKQSPSPM